MLPGGSVMAGVALRGVRAGERTEVATGGADEAPGDLKFLMHHAGMLLDEASKVGVHTPERFIFRGAQVFYRRGRPSEARVAGVVLSADGQAIIPWSTDPAPQWAEDGGMLPIDASRTHQSARVSQTESGPVLGRWWNLDEHVRSSFVPWRDFADLAESEADFPEALQGVARFVLGKLKEDGDAAAGYALSESGAPWRDKLVRRVKLRLVELRHAAGMDGETRPEEDSGADTTSKAAAWMAETFENGGKVSAEDLLEQAKSYPWAPWLPGAGFDFAFVLRRLTRLVWQNEIEAEAKQAANRFRQNPSAGLAAPVVTSIVHVAAAAAAAGRRGIQGQLDGQWLVQDRAGQPIARFRQAPDIEGSLVSTLGSITTQRIVRWAVWEAYEEKFNRGNDATFDTIIVDGGIDELARCLGLTGGRGRASVRDALNALSDLSIVTPNGEGRILSWHHHNATGRRKAWLQVTLLGPLRPDYIDDDLKGRSNRRLVPIPLPHLLPPMVGRPNDMAPQAGFQLLVMREFRTHAVELSELGSIEIDASRWPQLADESGVSRKLLPKILEVYPVGKDGNPAFLLSAGLDRYDLAPVYHREKASILAAAERIKSGRKSRRGKK